MTALNAVIQAQINKGYGIAAGVLGYPYDVYRPTGPTFPISSILTLPANFTVHSSGDFNFSKPSDYKGPMFHALVDGTNLQVFDYLIQESGAFGPFFIIAISPLVPILCVNCNRVITVKRRAADSLTHGSLPYGGDDVSTEVPLMTNWPASVLKGPRGVRESELPGSVGYGMFDVLLPYSSGVNLTVADILIDDIGNRYIIQSSELSDLGWRLLVQQAVP